MLWSSLLEIKKEIQVWIGLNYITWKNHQIEYGEGKG